MIQNVRSGQPLTAGLLNNIISQANGQDIPFNENFVNSDKGTLYISRQEYELRSNDASFYNFLECWVDDAPEITSRTEESQGSGQMKPYILINLGNSTEIARQNITVNNKEVDGIVLISNNPSLDTVVTDEILNNKDFIQLSELDGSSDSPFDVHFLLYKVIKSNSDDKPPSILGYALVISKEEPQEAQERAKIKIKEIECLNDLTHIEMLNHKKILASTANNQSLIQNVICSQDLIDVFDVLSSDTQVSDSGQANLTQYSTEIKSILGKKTDETGQEIPVEIKYVQLFDFDDAKITSINKNDVKKYSILVRYDASQPSNDESSDGEGSSEIDSPTDKKLKYVHYIFYSSDTAETEPDENDPNSSDKVVSKSVELIDKDVDEDSEEPSNIKYYQLYNFTNDSDKPVLTLSVNTEKEKDETSEEAEYSFLVRKKTENNYVLEYADLKIVSDLSSLSALKGDADDDSGADTKSIITKEYEDKKYFQLYNFDSSDTIKTDVSSIYDYDVLIRDGKELKYTNIDLSAGVKEIVKDVISNEIHIPTVDSNVVESKSLDEKEKDGEVYFQLHNFDDNSKINTNISTISNYDILIRDGNELKYTKLSIELSGGLSVALDNKSINYNDENQVQIYDFDKGEKLTTNLATLLSSGNESESTTGELLFRTNGQLEYLPIGKLNLSGTTEISVDNKSINYTTDNKLQVFNFDKGTTLTDDLATCLTSDTSDKGEVLVRKDGEIGYMSIGQLTSISDTQLSVANDTIIGYALEYSYDYEITLKRGRLTIENNVLKLVPDDKLTQTISTTPISEIIK